MWNIYDKYGNYLGEIREKYNGESGCLGEVIVGSIIIGLPICLVFLFLLSLHLCGITHTNYADYIARYPSHHQKLFDLENGFTLRDLVGIILIIIWLLIVIPLWIFIVFVLIVFFILKFIFYWLLQGW